MHAILESQTVQKPDNTVSKPKVEVFTLTNMNLITQRLNPD
jgi:hypothetical protein